MLTDEQHKRLDKLADWLDGQSSVYAADVRELLAVSAAPAEGREKWLDDVRRAIRAYAHACSHDKKNVCTRSDEIERLLARAALATATTTPTSESAAVAWECPSNHAILRDDSPDMCDLRRREWRALVYRDAPTAAGNASALIDGARNLRRYREKIIQAMRAPSRGDFTVAINSIVRNMTEDIKAIDHANAGIGETS